jgi:hypothetical protein
MQQSLCISLFLYKEMDKVLSVQRLHLLTQPVKDITFLLYISFRLAPPSAMHMYAYICKHI